MSNIEQKRSWQSIYSDLLNIADTNRDHKISAREIESHKTDLANDEDLTLDVLDIININDDAFVTTNEIKLFLEGGSSFATSPVDESHNIDSFKSSGFGNRLQFWQSVARRDSEIPSRQDIILSEQTDASRFEFKADKILSKAHESYDQNRLWEYALTLKSLIALREGQNLNIFQNTELTRHIELKSKWIEYYSSLDLPPQRTNSFRHVQQVMEAFVEFAQKNSVLKNYDCTQSALCTADYLQALGIHTEILVLPPNRQSNGQAHSICAFVSGQNYIALDSNTPTRSVGSSTGQSLGTYRDSIKFSEGTVSNLTERHSPADFIFSIFSEHAESIYRKRRRVIEQIQTRAEATSRDPSDFRNIGRSSPTTTPEQIQLSLQKEWEYTEFAHQISQGKSAVMNRNLEITKDNSQLSLAQIQALFFTPQSSE